MMLIQPFGKGAAPGFASFYRGSSFLPTKDESMGTVTEATSTLAAKKIQPRLSDTTIDWTTILAIAEDLLEIVAACAPFFMADGTARSAINECFSSDGGTEEPKDVARLSRHAWVRALQDHGIALIQNDADEFAIGVLNVLHDADDQTLDAILQEKP